MIKRLTQRCSALLCSVLQEDIRQCLYSIGDNNAFLAFNKEPVEKVISYLKRYFDPQKYEDKLSLAISAGRGGARLSHDHHRQYKYVLHSLTLWKNILHDMFRLWYLAEEDLLSEDNRYRYCFFLPPPPREGRKEKEEKNFPCPKKAALKTHHCSLLEQALRYRPGA